MNLDMIYEILLYVDVKTLKSFNMTHKHTFSKHFWMNKFKQDQIPVFDDYQLNKYERIITAKHIVDQLYQMILLEKEFH